MQAVVYLGNCGLMFFTILFFKEYIPCSSITQENETIPSNECLPYNSATTAWFVTDVVNPTIEPPGGECPAFDRCIPTFHANIAADPSNAALVCSNLKVMVSCTYEAGLSCGNKDILNSNKIFKAIADACGCTSGSSGSTVYGGISRLNIILLLLFLGCVHVMDV